MMAFILQERRMFSHMYIPNRSSLLHAHLEHTTVICSLSERLNSDYAKSKGKTGNRKNQFP